MPQSAALFITLLVTIVFVLVFASMIAWALSGIAEWLLDNVARFQTLYKQATDWLEEHGIFVAGILSERFDVLWLIRLFPGGRAEIQPARGASPFWRSCSS